MSVPIALGAAQPPLEIRRDAKSLSHQITPGKRLPVIDRDKVDPETLKAAEGMEAMFLDYLMKTMRQTVPKNDMDLESSATDMYRGMIDSENAQKAAHAGGVGMADQIVAYLQEQRYTLPRGSSPSANVASGVNPSTAQGIVPSKDPAKGQVQEVPNEGQSNRK